MRGHRHAPAAFYPRERPGTHCTGGWVGPRARLDRCRKSRPQPGFDPRTVQPVASRYTDWASLSKFPWFKVHRTVAKRCQLNTQFILLLGTPCVKQNHDFCKVLNLIVAVEWKKLVFRVREVVISELIWRQAAVKSLWNSSAHLDEF
jgi:hypothetical protein